MIRKLYSFKYEYINDGKFEDVINKEIYFRYVTIINYRGKNLDQTNA